MKRDLVRIRDQGLFLPRPRDRADDHIIPPVPALRAQVERASIIGKITDSTGAAMANVEITVTNVQPNVSVPATMVPDAVQKATAPRDTGARFW